MLVLKGAAYLQVHRGFTRTHRAQQQYCITLGTSQRIAEQDCINDAPMKACEVRHRVRRAAAGSSQARPLAAYQPKELQPEQPLL